MSGGSGCRLWPLSRDSYPKQFLPLVPSENNKTTLLQDTINRLYNIYSNPVIICNNEHRFIVAEQLRDNNTKASNIILEPMGKNTAPAITLAALASVEDDNDPLLLILAADHVIKDVSAFQASVISAAVFANKGNIVTFGVIPTYAETGYGYIKQGKVQTHQQTAAFCIANFVEKPNLSMAKKYLASGDYLWNSGIFMFKASRYLEELKKFSPEILEVCKDAYNNKKQDSDFIRISAEIFRNCPAKSIDYAIMEHTESAVVIPLKSGWCDIGSFSSLWNANQKDKLGNVVQGDIISHDTTNCYLNATSKLIATVGVNNLIIIETKDAILVAGKDKVQNIKEIIKQLKSKDRYEYKYQCEAYRPWGKYDSLGFGERYQVKRITVKPGAKLSIQIHNQRSKHWIVVSGTAKITTDDKTYLATENESNYIPLGQIHTLENPGILPLELIEVQTGSYLCKDNIIRSDAQSAEIKEVV